MFGRFGRSSVKPTISRKADRFAVRFTGGADTEHEEAFDTKRHARSFAREVSKWPADEPFDRKELARLSAEYTGPFARNAGQELGILPPKYK
jgi:hypothetical protein